MSSLLFLFDYVSPYSYLAATQIQPLAARHGRDVVPVPIVFGALLTTHGTRGPAEVPAKRAYLFRDILRIARALGVPLEPPATHPFNPLVALRATAMVDASEARWKLTEALFRAAWVQGRRIDEADVVRDVATEVGLDGTSLVAAAASADAKSRLRASTEDAIAAGVFGVPTVRADGELFWGVDSLPHLEAFLAGGAALPPELVLRWQSVTPSVTRKGGS